MRLLFLLSLFVSFTLEAKTYKINPQHSTLSFNVPFMKVTSVNGVFKEFKGYFNYNKATQHLNDLTLQISVSSIDTFEKKRDKHLLTKDFFDIQKYPYITFKSLSFSISPQSVTGILEIKGIKKEMSLPFKLKGPINDQNNKKLLFIELEGKINRRDFGINWSQTFDQGQLIVGDEIEFKAVIEANPVDSIPAFSRFFLPSTKEEKINSKEKKMVVDSSLIEDLDKLYRENSILKEELRKQTELSQKLAQKNRSLLSSKQEILTRMLRLFFTGLFFLSLAPLAYFYKRKKSKIFIKLTPPQFFVELLIDILIIYSFFILLLITLLNSD